MAVTTSVSSKLDGLAYIFAPLLPESLLCQVLPRHRELNDHVPCREEPAVFRSCEGRTDGLWAILVAKCPYRMEQWDNHPPKWGLVAASLLYGQDGRRSQASPCNRALNIPRRS